MDEVTRFMLIEQRLARLEDRNAALEEALAKLRREYNEHTHATETPGFKRD